MDDLAERLRQIREQMGLTQAELVKRARLRHQSTIGNLENRYQRGTTSLPAIAEALGVESTWLQTGKGPKHAPGKSLVEGVYVTDPVILQVVKAMEAAPAPFREAMVREAEKSRSAINNKKLLT